MREQHDQSYSLLLGVPFLGISAAQLPNEGEEFIDDEKVYWICWRKGGHFFPGSSCSTSKNPAGCFLRFGP
jgi:hypothetical protein